MNALKDGERSAKRIGARHELWELLKLLRSKEREVVAGDCNVACATSDAWIDRIAAEMGNGVFPAEKFQNR